MRGVCLSGLDEGGGILDDGGVVTWKIEVATCEIVDYRVDFDNGSLDTVRDECGGGSTDTEASKLFL